LLDDREAIRASESAPPGLVSATGILTFSRVTFPLIRAG
jgi:hypothetical protein